MEYSIVGILAVVANIIINHELMDMRAGEKASPARRSHHAFLLGITIFFAADALWGILAGLRATAIVYADTVLYFAAMAVSVFLWTRYVIIYLERSDVFGKALFGTGVVFLVFELIVLVVNIFYPILFHFDEAGTYHADIARYFTFGFQVVMFLLSSGYTLLATSKSQGKARRRYMAIGQFGLAMIAAVVMQMFFPLLPFYSVGYLLGSCVLHTFVVEDEKEEHREELEAHLERERRQMQEIGSVRRLAYTDSLTGVKSARAYMEDADDLNRKVSEGGAGEFAVAIFDLNDLKVINDTMGHEEGDRFIISACKLVCNCFKHSPVYRIGGDEFVAILLGTDYRERETLLRALDERVDRNLVEGEAVVAAGLADYNPMIDRSFSDVFERADSKMYLRKMALKSSDRSAVPVAE